jgi:rRNA maturation RNase YbeY
MRRHLNALGFEGFDVAIVIVGHRTSQTLNARYRKKDCPTNVLSFGYGLKDHHLGDVILNGEWALDRAKTNKLSYETVMTRLWVHGLLHLAGYDHERSPASERAMRMLERLLFQTSHPQIDWNRIEGIFEP